MRSKLSVPSIIMEVVLQLLWRSILLIFIILLGLIPKAGIIIAIILGVCLLLSLIAFIFKLVMDLISYVEITEAHIVGRWGLTPFDLSWDKVDYVKTRAGRLIIYRKKSKRGYIIDNLANEGELLGEYNRIKAKAAASEASTQSN